MVNNPQQPPYPGGQQYPNQAQPYIGFGDAIKICFTKYITFSGRASRAEYWWWFLFSFLVGTVTSMLNDYLSFAASLVLFIPSLAVAWRRMHDIGKGGGWWFINFIPVVGFIIFIIWCVKESEHQPNRFGPEP